ncbi:MAG: hypothetical protein AAF555_06190 [Verrucomicrobiota bacterium]
MRDQDSWRTFLLVLLSALFMLFTPSGSAEVPDADRYVETYKQYLDAVSPLPEDEIKHFVFIPRAEIREHSFLDNERIAGAQILYPWRALEKSRGSYDFSIVSEDLDYLTSRKKKLFIQLQDVTFHFESPAVPSYLRSPEFDGGEFEKKSDEGASSGWIAKRWNSRVRDRFALLLKALGKEFDGKVEGINLPETAAEGLSTERDSSFTSQLYAEGIKANMRALKGAFPKSVTIQYANFMPGEWLPWEDRRYLRSIYEYGEEIGVGLGGPDLMVRRKAQLNHALALMHENRYSVPLSIAVQRGNYIGMTGADVGPGQSLPKGNHQQPTDVPMLHAFARDFLRVDYIFWQNEEPYFTRDVLSHLR